MVIFDRKGCGDDSTRAHIQATVLDEIERNGWSGRSAVIVVEPELETWLWTHSPEVSAALGWGEDFRKLRTFLDASGLWPKSSAKPLDPKKTAAVAIREAPVRRKPRRSTAWFADLARRIPLDGCRDLAFQELLTTLRTWFPEPPGEPLSQRDRLPTHTDVETFPSTGS